MNNRQQSIPLSITKDLNEQPVAITKKDVRKRVE